MRVLLDNCIDYEFGKYLLNHAVKHARDLRWERLSNGELLAAAEAEGFDAMVTVDKSLRSQQNLKGRKLSIITLDSPKVTLPHLVPMVGQLLAELEHLAEGTFVTVSPDL